MLLMKTLYDEMWSEISFLTFALNRQANAKSYDQKKKKKSIIWVRFINQKKPLCRKHVKDLSRSMGI